MRWTTCAPGHIESETVCDANAAIVSSGDVFVVYICRRDLHDERAECATLDDAKAVALDLMRAEVVRARGEAENTICHASRWLRANGGEP